MIKFWFCFLILSCVTPSQSLPPFNDVFISVQNQKLSQDLLITSLKLAKLNSFTETSLDFSTADSTQILAKWIDELRILAYADQQGIKVLDTEVQELLQKRLKQLPDLEPYLDTSGIIFERFRELLQHQARLSLILTKLIGVKISVNDILVYYREHQVEFKVPERVRVRELFIKSDNKLVTQLHERALKNENFAKLVMLYSEKSFDKKDGGDSGFISRGSWPEVLENTVFSLKKGEISKVLKSEWGYHLFKLIEMQPAKTKSMNEVFDEVAKKIWFEKYNVAYMKLLEKIRPTLVVEIPQDKWLAVLKMIE